MTTLRDPVSGETFRLVTRAEWGARPPRWTGSMVRFDGCHSHHGVGPGQPSMSIWRGYQSYHMNSLGWPDIAYNYGYDSEGTIYEGRGWGRDGAHTFGYNNTSYGFCFIGDSNVAPPTGKALRALLCLARLAEAHHNKDGYRRDHIDAGRLSGSATSCPGNGLYGKFAAMPKGYRPTNPPAKPNPAVPVPPGEDPDTMKPKMMTVRDGANPQNPSKGTWIVYDGSPWRIRVKSAEDFRLFQFFGVPSQNVTPQQWAFFQRNTSEIKTR